MRVALTRSAGAMAILLTTLLSVAAPATAAERVAVGIDPPASDLRLGDATTLTITVTNNGDAPTGRLAVHIDVTSPTGSGSVDPEDWSATLTRRIDSIEPGASRRLDWRLQPISGGRFVAYAVAIPVDDGTDVFVSNGVTITVEERRSLNPEGVLPVAIGAPAVVGVLLLSRVRRGRQR
ncbi:MAG: hypothetical protein R8F63_14200 [Acidimicrobiales bacterium]|nr:hypothetical protein [Acidimicrobiales bacterium]